MPEWDFESCCVIEIEIKGRSSERGANFIQESRIRSQFARQVLPAIGRSYIITNVRLSRSYQSASERNRVHHVNLIREENCSSLHLEHRLGKGKCLLAVPAQRLGPRLADGKIFSSDGQCVFVPFCASAKIVMPAHRHQSDRAPKTHQPKNRFLAAGHSKAKM